MSPKEIQYKAYWKATTTVAKTRQVVMLYDGAIRFLKQAATAVKEGKIEDRYNLTVKSSEIMMGLQSSIDFENGGEIASILHEFYTNVSRRIIYLNFIRSPQECEAQCTAIISELKQMRDVWDNIDHTLNAPENKKAEHAPQAMLPTDEVPAKPKPEAGVALSA